MAKKVVDPREKIMAELTAMVNKYNESAEFAEYATMHKLSEDMDEKVTEYNKLSEKALFSDLVKAENPMLEAAKVLRYATIKVKDEKQDVGGTQRVIVPASKPIDPLRLHKFTKDGIGHDKLWQYRVERLNFLFTVRRAIELGIDPATLGDYAIHDEAKKIEGFKSVDVAGKAKFDIAAANKSALEDVQNIVNAMIGDGYKVSEKMVSYLLMIYQKKDNRQSLSVSCANHKFMRQYMLEICHAAITGKEISLDYKRQK